MITLRQLREFNYRETIGKTSHMMQSTWWHVPTETAYTTRGAHDHSDMIEGYGGKYKSIIHYMGGPTALDKAMVTDQLKPVYMSEKTGKVRDEENGKWITPKKTIYMDEVK